MRDTAGGTHGGPSCGWRGATAATTMQRMKKRVLAAMLWFYAGWYAGAILAEFIGVSPVLGPLIGAAAAGLIVIDPLRTIWTTRTAAASSSSEAMPEAA